MSTDQPNPPSTAVAPMVARPKPPLPPMIQMQLDERKAMNIVAAKIAGLSWGENLDLEARRALAEYGRQKGIDVTTEIYILGNRIYKNAEYYINRAQPYVRAGVLSLDYEYINHDKRLDELAKSTDIEVAANAKREIQRRLQLRIDYNVPEGAQSAALATVHILKFGTKFRAAKWCGNGVNKGDPVGNEKPEATSVTRALRKVIKTAAGYEPQILDTFGNPDAEKDDSIELEAAIARSKAEIKELRATSIDHNPVNLALGAGHYDGVDTTQRMPAASIAAIAQTPDPYAVQEEMIAAAFPPAPTQEIVPEAPKPPDVRRVVVDPDDPNFYDQMEEDQPGLSLDDTRKPGKGPTDALREG